MERDVEKLVQLAIADLAKREDVLRSGIQVLSTQARQFRDASLGVKQPGRMYAQVLTPGYVITLESHGHRYVYHGSANRVVLAQG